MGKGSWSVGKNFPGEFQSLQKTGGGGAAVLSVTHSSALHCSLNTSASWWASRAASGMLLSLSNPYPLLSSSTKPFSQGLLCKVHLHCTPSVWAGLTWIEAACY